MINHLYKIFILITCFVLLAGCAAEPDAAKETGYGEDTRITEPVSGSDPETAFCTGSMQLDHADQFSVDYYSDGTAKVSIADREYVFSSIPTQIYVASSSVMDYFRELDALGLVTMTGTDYDSWDIPEIRELVYEDEISFVGKYNAPDFEYILSEGCDLVIENTMVYHSPEILEEFDKLGIPVIVERSSHEKTALGRLEWIKLYGLLSGHLEEAEQFFENSCEEIRKIEESIRESEKRPKAGYFYVNASGMINVRGTDDYMIQMLETAGGEYCIDIPEGSIGSGSHETINMDMESFYASAADADVLIYNGVISGDVNSLEDLLEKNPLFADFKAVKEHNVWIAGDNIFQESTGIARMIGDYDTVFHEKDAELKYLKKLD